jgi:hypothetical protein
MPFNLDTLNEPREDFNLSEQNIGEAEIERIAEKLAANESMRTLDLSGNPISVRGLKILSKSLSRHPRLERLVLTGLHNNSQPKGPEYIQALAPIFGNPQLRELILSENGFNFDAIQLLAKILKTNTTLTFLNIYDSNCELEGESAALAAAMENNTRLILNVHCNAGSKILEYNARNFKAKEIYDDAVFLCSLADRSLGYSLAVEVDAVFQTIEKHCLGYSLAVEGDAVFQTIEKHYEEHYKEYYENLKQALQKKGKLPTLQCHPSHILLGQAIKQASAGVGMLSSFVQGIYQLAIGRANEAKQLGYDPASDLKDRICDHQKYMPLLHDKIQWLNIFNNEIASSFQDLYAALCNEPINQNTKTFSIIANHFIGEADKTLGFRTYQDIENSAKQLEHKLYGKPPMSKALKAVICGVIGALVGAALGIAVGAAVTAWGGGFGALPAAMLGAVQGFSTGISIGLGVGIGVGGKLGGQLGFWSSKQNHEIYHKKKTHMLRQETSEAVRQITSTFSNIYCNPTVSG